jgi:hypothetical protein
VPPMLGEDSLASLGRCLRCESRWSSRPALSTRLRRLRCEIADFCRCPTTSRQRRSKTPCSSGRVNRQRVAPSHCGSFAEGVYRYVKGVRAGP